MYPHVHFIAGILGGIIGWRLGYLQQFDILYTAAAAVLIDIDHFLNYCYHERDFSPRRFWNQCTKYTLRYLDRHRTFIHYPSGMIIILPLLALVFYFSPRIGFIGLAAYISHISLDYLKYIGFLPKRFWVLNLSGFKIPFSYKEGMVFIFLLIISAFLFFTPIFLQ